MRIIVTGGAGFIGSAVVRQYITDSDHEVINLDALTYAGNLESLAAVEPDPRYYFEHVDIRDQKAIERVFNKHRPHAIMHLAAESHVDRSIDGPADFIQTNIVGTYHLLEVARRYWNSLDDDRKRFRFHHVSTDEVFGDLAAEEPFTENAAYVPSSPYSASKASSDHLVRAWHRTYGLPVVVTHCSNNYGPYQFPEKLIPLITLNALEGKALPVYRDGSQARDWLYVEDHARALRLVLENGKTGESYNIGGHNDITNLDVVKSVCCLLDRLVPDPAHKPHDSLIRFVADRPGHDSRYAMDTNKIRNDLGWMPRETFESGLEKTVRWYLNNRTWCQHVQNGTYQRERLGIAAALR